MKKTSFIAIAFLMMTTACTTILVETTGPEGLTEDPGSRTAGAVVEDEAIQTRIIVNMKSQEPRFKNSNFNVISHNGVVLIVGQVQTDELRTRASEIASQASSKIKRIHNELEVAGRTTFLARTNDTWISSKVRLQLTANKEVPASQIRVVSNNGTVYLMGMLSQSEGDQAALLARNVAGVAKVVKVFEYI